MGFEIIAYTIEILSYNGFILQEKGKMLLKTTTKEAQKIKHIESNW